MTAALLAGFAFAVSLAAVRIVERYAAALRLVDRPNQRSSHVQPRPRGGGLGILCGVAAAVALAAAIRVPISRDFLVILGAALAVAACGLWDDLRPLSIWPRLLVQGTAATAVVGHLGGLVTLPLPPPADVALPGVAGQVLMVLWLVGVTNFFNFMDGLDGLAGGQAIITLAAIALVQWPQEAADVALIIAAATAGFLVRNWSPAKIFLGDVGSSFLGFVLAALPLTAQGSTRSPLLLLVATSLTLFLLDPVATLIVRYRRGARLGESHREHAYQQFIPRDQLHGPAVSRLLMTVFAVSVAAIGAYWSPALQWPALGAALLAFAIEWRLAGTSGP